MLRVVFMGTPDFAVPTLEKLIASGHQVQAVVTQPDRRRGRGKKVKPSPVKKFAMERGLTVLQPDKLDADFVAQLVALKPDVAVVVAYGKLLPEAVLSLPGYGCINIHGSLLPKYRGAAPLHWAVINGENESGVSIMRMDKGMDTGPVLAYQSVPIAAEDTTGTLHDQLAQVGADLLVETLAELPRGIKEHPQDDGLATDAPPLTKQDEQISWRRPAQDIVNQVRGMNPWPGTYTIYQDKRLKIFAAEVFPHLPVLADALTPVPGKVIEVNQLGIVVAVGANQAVLLTEVQPPGKQRMRAADFLRGYQVEVGQRLGGEQDNE